jgi:hypothetical protein
MSTAIFLLAHPDDEFAIFPVIRDEVKFGANFIYLTDGCYNGQDAQRRKNESLTVLKKFGLNAKSVFFIGIENKIPDGSLHALVSKAFDCCLNLFFKLQLDIRNLYIPAWEGGHQDHDAAHILGLAIAKHFKIMNRTLQFSLYHGENLPGPFFKVLSPLQKNGDVITRKIPFRHRIKYMRLCLSYPSQKMTWIGLFPSVFISYLLKGQNRLQKINTARILEKPHDGRVLYERRGFLKHENFVGSIKTFSDKYIHGI